ncbi:MarR family winged helix-turn-helix transcriptional regulator [Rathayibacter toxicus]|uniref:MarR family transcriptional regulator n=1 Tax=Rathayibacter toxicus TaxID=145458 RepID=A0A0C5BGF5_9MICO|nr:MarR family transcriptional regulator [Rathayibacter toxicus]AJM77305.1 MarR family transcriptional regulator [Rathayibacter toxicus]ALS56827.1 MarR family transcriptional regulator [Rathayibacter toxicus]KKM46329.1 MarR family transcriptional regulator [Rathayibacter toxicus]PPG23310.1 MarR family transcriptional regulator [Rathayibacter toxicus]PPG47893.1 MarR family transcriptional regulator [Rathayibacter toxicus]
MSAKDEVDGIVDAWVHQRPDLDFTPLQVFSRMRRLAKKLERARSTAFGHSELETWEFDVLSALRRAGPPYRLSPKQLLHATMVTSGTMTNRIDRLVERQLVVRLDDPHDGRGILAQMTPAGLAHVDAAITLLLVAEQDLLVALTRPQQERLAHLLRKLSLEFD